MDNIITYAENMLDTLEKTPFNAVDSLILSWITCVKFPDELTELRSWKGVRFADLFRSEFFGTYFSNAWGAESGQKLFTAMAASPRWRDMYIMGLTEKNDSDIEQQFAAMCYRLMNGETYIAFRGTDSTFVGWKEDFNMAYQYPVPSQREALKYLASAAENCGGALRVGGHSKGGNLAVYAAANCDDDIKNRIIKIYSHDGPGFLDEALQSEAFRSIIDRLDKTVPQSSLVGLLMESQEKYRIVKSSRHAGILQHDPFSWEVSGCDFSPSDSLTPNARYLDKTLNEWILSLSSQEREQFVDTLYRIIKSENADTFPQLWNNRHTAIPSIARTVSSMDKESRRFMQQIIHRLLDMGAKNFSEILPPLGSAKK